MSIKFVNTPSLEGMDAQITPVVGENPLCRIPSVRALYTAVSRQELMSQKPGTVQGFVLAFEEGLKEHRLCQSRLPARPLQAGEHRGRGRPHRCGDALQKHLCPRVREPTFQTRRSLLICQGLMIGAYHFDLYKSEKIPQSALHRLLRAGLLRRGPERQDAG